MPRSDFITPELLEGVVERCKEEGMDITTVCFALSHFVEACEQNATTSSENFRWRTVKLRIFDLWNGVINSPKLSASDTKQAIESVNQRIKFGRRWRRVS